MLSYDKLLFEDYLEQAIHNCLVGKIRSESIQKRLSAEVDLTLKSAIEVAVGMEAADETTKA